MGNTFARNLVQDRVMLVAIYQWLERGGGSSVSWLTSPWLGIVAASLAKLGVASPAEVGILGLRSNCYESAWTWMLEQTTARPPDVLRDVALLVVGIAHVLKDTANMSASFYRALHM